MWPNKTPTSVDFEQLKAAQTFSFYIRLFLSIKWIFLLSLDSSTPISFGRDVCVHPLVRNTNLVWSQLGLTLPTNTTLFCRQWADGSACLRALPGDLHDALIIQIFDSHEVSGLIHSVPLGPLSYECCPCFAWVCDLCETINTVCVCLFVL